MKGQLFYIAYLLFLSKQVRVQYSVVCSKTILDKFPNPLDFHQHRHRHYLIHQMVELMEVVEVEVVEVEKVLCLYHEV